MSLVSDLSVVYGRQPTGRDRVAFLEGLWERRSDDGVQDVAAFLESFDVEKASATELVAFLHAHRLLDVRLTETHLRHCLLQTNWDVVYEASAVAVHQGDEGEGALVAVFPSVRRPNTVALLSALSAGRLPAAAALLRGLALGKSSTVDERSVSLDALASRRDEAVGEVSAHLLKDRRSQLQVSAFLALITVADESVAEQAEQFVEGYHKPPVAPIPSPLALGIAYLALCYREVPASLIRAFGLASAHWHELMESDQAGLDRLFPFLPGDMPEGFEAQIHVSDIQLNWPYRL